MGDFRDIRRKIVRWEEVVQEPEYRAVLECGHLFPDEHGAIPDSGREAVEKDGGGAVVCRECTEEEHMLVRARIDIAEVKERRKRRGDAS